MGKIDKIGNKEIGFTKIQKDIFDEFSREEELTEKFYFTGGTALSAIYLHHRESEDLDFFSENEFDNLGVQKFIEIFAEKHRLQTRFTKIEKTRIFELVSGSGNVEIKVDFNYYPYKRIEKGLKVNNVEIDSLLDIASNKLQTIISRTEVKDFVDLYFLLQEYTTWDLIYAVKHKFSLEVDVVLLASDFLKVESFDYLPNMLVPLDIRKLKSFFKEKAKQLAAKVVKK